jgi:hypothetical protein
VATDLPPQDPRLGPLQDNGGATFTMALLPGSPALNAGSNGLAVDANGQPLLTDQRGFTRAVDGTVDVGAFEVQHYVVTTTADSGTGSLRSAVTAADLAGGSAITFSVSGSITLASALPDIGRSVQILGPGATTLTVQRSAATGTPAFRILTVGGPTGGIQDVTVTLAGLTLANGQVTDFFGSGGGIDNAGTLTVANCALTGNAASIGGGIDNAGTLTVTGSTLSDNQAPSGVGGAIVNAQFGRLALANCTLARNSASSAGGIDNGLLGTVTLTNCTRAGNSAASTGGGVYNAGGRLTVANTIVAGNTAPTGPDVFGSVTSSGNNLIGNPSGSNGFGASGDLVGTPTQPVDPLLAPLGDYGGPTATMALGPGSPALDRGSNALAVDPSGAPLATDQRGFARVVNGTVDIGAFEVQDLVNQVAWAVDADGFWDVASNWLDDQGVSRVPGPNNDVVIDRATPVTVTHRTGSDTVHSITGRDALAVSSFSTLTITGAVDVKGGVTLLGGTLSQGHLSAGTTVRSAGGCSTRRRWTAPSTWAPTCRRPRPGG